MLRKITYFDVTLQSYNQVLLWTHMMSLWYGSTEYNTEHNSELYAVQCSEDISAKPNYTATYAGSNTKYNPESDHESHIYNGATVHLEAIWDKSSAEQQSLRREMKVLESQQLITRTIAIPEMLQWSTVKHTHK